MAVSVSSSVQALSGLLRQALDGGGAGVLLLSVRVAAVFLMTPVLYAVPLPATVRALLVLGLSVALACGLGAAAMPPVAPERLWQAALAELALGATLGLGILLAFASFAIAGQILDVQIGFGIAQAIDPVTRRPVPVLTSAFQTLAVLVFFLVDGHHALLRGLAWSLHHFPVGAAWAVEGAAPAVLRQAAGLFSLGFALAAPVIFCVLLTEFALGVVARNLPQMNMFALGIPVKVLVGLAALSLWFTGIGGTMTRAYGGIASTWDQIFRATPAAMPAPPLPLPRAPR